jgi:superfamily II DNA or RNA helicase
MSIAPYRLGLTATPECNDDGDAVLAELVGPICFRRDIDELEGAILAPYETHRIELPLDDDEAEAYERNRKTYIDFVRANGVNFGNPRGWQQFTGLCARMPDGRAVFNAYLAQKRIAAASRGKFRMIWDLIQQHAGERTLIFTADNNTAYALGRQFLVPVITQHTKVVERKAFLDKFRAGDYPVLVSSKVLNEGIDVPEASVGIVVSGSGSIREHVQRLGRILRPVVGKQAQLYELVSEGTSEYHISDRRRQHRAYQRSS